MGKREKSNGLRHKAREKGDLEKGSRFLCRARTSKASFDAFFSLVLPLSLSPPSVCVFCVFLSLLFFPAEVFLRLSARFPDPQPAPPRKEREREGREMIREERKKERKGN